MGIRAKAAGLNLLGIRGFVQTSLAAIGRNRRLLLLVIGVATLAGAIQAILFFVLAMIGISLSSPVEIPHLIRWIEGDWRPDINLLMAIAIGLAVLTLGLTFVQARLQSRISARATATARLRLSQAYTRSSQTYRATIGESHLHQLIAQNGYNLGHMVDSFVLFCVAIVTLIALILIPFALNPKVGMAIAAMALGSVALIGPLGKVLRRDHSEVMARNRLLFSYTAQLERISDDIQAYDVGPAVEHQMWTRIDASEKAQRKTTLRDIAVPAAYQYGALVALLAAIAFVLHVYPGTHPGIAVFAMLMLRIIGYARHLIHAVQQGRGAAPYVDQLTREIATLEANPAAIGTGTPTAFTGLTLRDVTFAYDDGSEVLHSISLDITPGEAIGIVGASGGGKSTLCALLLGLKSPGSGSITMDGVAVHQMRRDAWARVAAYMPQNCLLLTGTVADNIRFFREGYSDADVEAAAQAAHIHAEILQLPHGYKTTIGPGARGLSGGQRQRLTIARALLGKPDLLILDEPSSALDPLSERLLTETLAELKAGATTLVMVGHRPVALEICDRVLRLEEGRLLDDSARLI